MAVLRYKARMSRAEEREAAGKREGDDVTPRSLRRNVVHAVLGMGGYSAAQLLVTVLLAKFAGSDVLGTYFYALSLSTPIILLLGFELRAAFVADVRAEFSFGAYRSARNVGLLLAAALLALLLLRLQRGGADGATLALIAAVFGCKLAWAHAELGWGLFNRHERLDLMGRATGLRGAALVIPYAILLPLSAFGWPAKMTPTWSAALASMIVCGAWSALTLVHDRPGFARLPRSDAGWNWRAVWGVLQRAAPLGLVAAAVNLNDSVPRIFVQERGSAAALGFFGAVATIPLVAQLIIVQTANAASNRLSAYYTHDRPAFGRLFGRLLLLAGGLGAVMFGVLAIGAEPILRYAYRAEYVQYAPELRMVATAQVLALFTAVFGCTATQMRVYWPQVPAQAVTLGATTIAAMMLIPGNPVHGAALTALIRAGAQFVAYLVCVSIGIARQAEGSAPRKD